MRIKALAREGGRLRFIDQTKLPLELKYREVDDYKEIIEAIKELQIRGAPAIGIAAAYGLAVAVEKAGEFKFEHLRQVAKEFKEARPTAINLAWAVDRVIRFIEGEQPTSFEAARDLLWAEAEAIHTQDRMMCEAIGRNGAELVGQKATILTHCTRVSGSGGAVGQKRYGLW